MTLVYDIIDSSSFGTKTDVQFATVDSVRSSLLSYLHFLITHELSQEPKRRGGDEDGGGGRSW